MWRQEPQLPGSTLLLQSCMPLSHSFLTHEVGCDASPCLREKVKEPANGCINLGGQVPFLWAKYFIEFLNKLEKSSPSFSPLSMAAIFIQEVSTTMEFLVKNGQRQGWPLLNACQQANAKIHTSYPSRRKHADGSGASCYSRTVNVFAGIGVPSPGVGEVCLNFMSVSTAPGTFLSYYINVQIS